MPAPAFPGASLGQNPHRLPSYVFYRSDDRRVFIHTHSDDDVLVPFVVSEESNETDVNTQHS